MSYEPRQFWEQRLREHFDLRGTGETGLSLAYNRACYALRREVLERALREAHVALAGASVLDVGCGTGFFTNFYLERGARVTGIDIAAASVERLAAEFPEARFVRADVGEEEIAERYDLVNMFDVFFHITDDWRWEFAMRNVAGAVSAGGVLVYTDVFSPSASELAHNRTRPLVRHLDILQASGFKLLRMYPTHVLLNHDLGPFRFLNAVPALLLGVDRVLLAAGVPGGRRNQLLIARRGA